MEVKPENYNYKIETNEDKTNRSIIENSHTEEYLKMQKHLSIHLN